MEGSVAELKVQLEKEEKTQKDIKGKVPWSVFIWVVGIMTATVGASGVVAMAAQEKSTILNERVSSLEGDIKAINVKLEQLKEDTTWIRNKLDK